MCGNEIIIIHILILALFLSSLFVFSDILLPIIPHWSPSLKDTDVQQSVLLPTQSLSATPSLNGLHYISIVVASYFVTME